MAQTFKLACLIVLACYVTISHQNGTTSHIEKIFKGRCLNYILTRSNLLASAPDVNCDDLWQHFSSVWRNRPSCGDHAIIYDQLFQHLAQKLPRDKLLFWSGTGVFAHKLSDNGRRYVTLEDTLIGSIADGLTWCGHTSGNGINNETCPQFGSCAAEPMKNFWLAASRWFASQAAGEVSVLLNGSNPSREAYSKGSIFGSLEVPSLQSDAVRKLTAIVVHDLGKPKIESCTSQSLLDLKSEVLAKNIEFDCYVNPKEVKLLLCLDSPHDPECAQQSAAVILGNFMHGSSMWARLTSATTMATLLMISFMCM